MPAEAPIWKLTAHGTFRRELEAPDAAEVGNMEEAQVPVRCVVGFPPEEWIAELERRAMADRLAVESRMLREGVVLKYLVDTAKPARLVLMMNPAFTAAEAADAR